MQIVRKLIPPFFSHYLERDFGAIFIDPSVWMVWGILRFGECYIAGKIRRPVPMLRVSGMRGVGWRIPSYLDMVAAGFIGQIQIIRVIKSRYQPFQ
jgi:hypothetical protein